MKIVEMTATFGKLNRANLTLEDGLNVIHAPNEGGKSTWCAFLRAMFYGISTRERDKKGVLAEKNRWQPWSGAPMEGEVRLVWQGKEITLRRFNRGSVPFGGFSAVYTHTQEPVPGLTGDNCGEMLLGVGREVWERSAFIGQTPTLAIDGTPELERRIAALVTTGQEDVSFSQTEQLLRLWQRRRRHNRTGLIPKLEEELALVQDRLEQVASAQERVTRGAEECIALEQELTLLQEEEQIHRRLARRRLNQSYAHALEERALAQQETQRLENAGRALGTLPDRAALEQLRTRLLRLALQEEACDADEPEQEALSAPAGFAGMDAAQALAYAYECQQQGERLQAQLEDGVRRRWLCLLPGGGLAVGLAASALWLTRWQPLLWAAAGVAFVAASGMLLWWNRRSLRRRREELERLLRPFGVQRPEEIVPPAQEYHARAQQRRHSREQRLQRQQQLEQEREPLLAQVRAFAPQVHTAADALPAVERALALEQELEHSRARLNTAEAHCRVLEEQGAQALDTLEMLHPPHRTPEQTGQALAHTQERLTLVRRQTATAQGELLSLGDRAQLEARAQELEEQRSRRQLEYEALELALDCLRQANDRLQERFAPELNRRAGELLQQLTGGRYQELALNRTMEASVRSGEEILPRSTLTLSRGTADQVYLAVRLAVCQLCLGQEEASPLVLDDALLTFDDERMKLALDCLAGLGRQVVLFSCQERELRLDKGHIQSLQS